ANKIPLPEYCVSDNIGGTFGVTLMVDGMVWGCGYASTKKQAEQNAAQIAIKTMKLQIPKHVA
ncbi:hypothetical protein EBT31_05380, partial [bacterium]|nr:hypothetical protein [bacterium]